MGLYTTTQAYIIVLLFLTVAGLVKAIDCAPSSSSFTIKSAQDVIELNACSVFTGDIKVAADAPAQIALNGLRNITGYLEISNVSGLQSLSSDTMVALPGFRLDNLPQLSTLSFPALYNFSFITLNNLPSLKQATIATGQVLGDIRSISVANTSLESLEWLRWPISAQLEITGNNRLATFDIPYAAINSGSSITIDINAALASVNVSRITNIYGALAISLNPNISELVFTRMHTIGGYVQLRGDFRNASFPSINTIPGALSVRSTKDISDVCLLLSGRNLDGHYDCTGNVDRNNLSNTQPTSSATASGPTAVATPTTEVDPSSGALSDGAKTGIALAVIVIVVLGLICAFFYLRRRIRSGVQEITKPETAEVDSNFPISEAYTSSQSFPKELESSQMKLEIGPGKERQELPSAVPVEMDAADRLGKLSTPVIPVSPSSSVGSFAPLIRYELPA